MSCSHVISDDAIVSTGSHVKYHSSIHESIAFGIKLGMYAMQFYMGSSVAYARSKVGDDDISKSIELLSRYPCKVFTHSPLIYNLAGSVSKKSLAWVGNDEIDSLMLKIINSINYELGILSKVGIIGTVIHPGYRTSTSSVSETIQAIATTINKLSFDGSAKVILEVCAGETNRIGKNLLELALIRELCDRKEMVGFCVDTAHVFGSGLYDLRNIEGVSDMFSDIDLYGNVCLIHLNDSDVQFNTKKDRHALLGTGYIWKEDMTSLCYLLKEAGKRSIPVVLETSPSDMNVLLGLQSSML